MYICKYCKSERKSGKSLIAHEATCPDNPVGYRNVPWNKGKTKENDSRLLSVSNEKTGKKRAPHTDETKKKIRAKATGKAATPLKEAERIQKIKEKAKLNNGGYRQGSGRGKKGWYKGIYCDSSWELAYLIYCLDHRVEITRNTEKRQYYWNNKIQNYIPDFVVNETLIEIKGYRTAQWDAKLAANPDVTVLYEEDLSEVFTYVYSKYGKHFIELYE